MPEGEEPAEETEPPAVEESSEDAEAPAEKTHDEDGSTESEDDEAPAENPPDEKTPPDEASPEDGKGEEVSPEAEDGEGEVDLEDEEKTDLEPVCESAYTNLQNRFGVTLPVFLSEKSWFSVSDSGYRLFFRMTGIRESESVLEKEADPPEDPLQKALFVHYSSTVLYPDAIPGAELKYDVCGQSLKETVTFPELGVVPEQLSYEIWAEGMTAEVAEDGEIHFFADGKEVFCFSAPFLMDSEGTSSGSLSVELEELDEGCFILRCTPDREWLESEDRAWPVILDPTIRNTISRSYIQDSFIRKYYPDLGGGSFYYFYAGYYSNRTKAARGLIKHTQLPTLESGDVIVRATLQLHGCVWESDSDQVQVNIHAITGSWNASNVTWNTQPTHEDEVLDFQLVTGTYYDDYIWDVTRAVQRWYNGTVSEKGPLANQGFMLIAPTENIWTILKAQFQASETTASNCWPILTIEYRNTSGLESYWDYTSAGAGRAGTVYANNATGNLVLSRCDMSYSGNRMPASIVFTYNQNDCTTDIGYGKGWRSSYSQSIEQVSISGTTYYKWTDGDGTRIYFKYYNSKQKWLDENGQSYELSIGASGYTISDRDDNSLVFDANGRLISMTDKLSNSLNISYTESGTTNLRISRVTDGAGRVYDFNYSNDLLSSVVYKGAGSTAIETVSYTYTSGALTAVTYADGKSAGYTYNNNTLEEARDILRGNGTCNKLQIEYDGTPAKVKGISYYDGATLVNSVSLSYADHNTIVTDNTGRWCSYEFNDLCNTVSVYNQAGQALYGSFASDESSSGRANQLTSSSRLQDTVVNLLDTRIHTGTWSETVSVQSGEMYSLSGLTAAGSTLSMSAGNETQTATSVSATERTELTIRIPVGVTSLTISGSGNVWDLQLEQAEAASRYNMLQNTDMNSSSGWTGTNLGANDGIDTVSGSRAKLNSSALVLEGVGTGTKRYSQSVSVNGSAGDNYSFGGWVKSGSVPLNNPNRPNIALQRRCGIEVRLLNGSTEVDHKYVAANEDCQEWQFISGSIHAAEAYDTVEYSFVYDYNANSSSFDGAQLFREKFAYVLHYDSEGRVDKVTDLEGRETTYTYRGTTSDVTSITLPGGAQYSYSYSDSGLLLSAVSDTGVTSSYTYDTYGNPTGTSISGSGEKNLTSYMTYTADGNMPASVTGNDGETVTYTNDTDRSLVLSVTDPTNTVTTNTFDVLRHPLTTQTGSSSVTNSYSDDLLVGLSHTNTANSSTQYTLSYTTSDLLYSVQVGSTYTLVQNSYNPGTWTLARQDYGNGAGWAYSYNQFDQVTARWTTNGTSGVEFQYFYNSEGALARVEQYETTLSNGSITSRTLVNTERYYYDTGDRLIRVWETDAGGNQHEFRWTYDNNDQVTELVETVNGQTFTYANSYNGDQQPTQSSYGNVLESFTYDGLGRLSQSAVSYSNSTALTTNYAYRDLDATRTSTQVAEIQNLYGLESETISYTYDSRGNIASITFPWTYPEPDPTPTPTPPPDPTPTPPPGGGGHGGGTGWGDPEIGGDDPVIPILPTPTPDVGLDSGGSGGSGNTATTATIYYTYDALNELTWEKNEAEGKAWNYTYDLGGNILSKTEYSYEDGVVGSTPLSTVTYTYGDADWGDLLTSYDGSPITYDAIGNPLSYRGWSFTWQGGRQLASASDGTTSLSFVYNESGLRMEKTVGSASHRYVYRGSTLVAEITDDYALYFHHDANGGIVGFTYVSGNTQTEYFYRKNLQGDVIGIVDSSGASVAEYRYDAWGQVLEATGTMASINPIRYRGYYYDAETGMYYLQSRYYDPVVGRFINGDAFGSTGQGILGRNMFAYCESSPVIYSDPHGHLVFGSFGFSANGDAGAGGSAGYLFIWDTYGNSALIFCGYVGGGTPNLSGSLNVILLSNADTIFDYIEAETVSAGGSFSYIGVDTSVGFTKDRRIITSFQLSLSVSLWAPIEAELHAGIGYTIPLRLITYHTYGIPLNAQLDFFYGATEYEREILKNVFGYPEPNYDVGGYKATNTYQLSYLN
ncbi:MAG: DNRLRE domain-containing protein [Oscillospiraceae bacterium]|nr:DNRLRE domain-containing protein [Oscillospiraceae bacterium]